MCLVHDYDVLVMKFMAFDRVMKDPRRGAPTGNQVDTSSEGYGTARFE